MPRPVWIHRQSVEARVARRTAAVLADYAQRPAARPGLPVSPRGWVPDLVAPPMMEDPRSDFPLWSGVGETVDWADSGPATVPGSAPTAVGPDDRAAPAGESGRPRPDHRRRVGWTARLLAHRGLRVDPGRRGAAAVGMAAVVAIVVAGTWVLVDRPHANALGAPSATSSAPATSGSLAISASSAGASPASGAPPASVSPTSNAVLVIDVVGKVRHPGVYRLPAGSRIDDALQAAGGALPGVDLSTLNLAQLISDGEQVAVGVSGAPAAAGGGGTAIGTGGATTGTDPVPVNLNTATAEQFDTLPGVGPVLSQRIVAWRTAHGRFTSVDQLREVSGIGPAKFADLKSLVTV